MKTVFAKSLALATSILSVITGSSSLALEGQISEGKDNFREAKLVDALIENGAFRAIGPDSANYKIQIDEARLLSMIRSELSQKLKHQRSTSQQENEIYKALLKNLKAGSFGKKNYGSGLNSMSFDKQ